MHFDIYTVILPWSQMTSISIVDMYPYECADILRYAVCLVYFSGATIQERNPTNVPPVLPHTQLESLMLGDSDYSLHLLLDALTTPALRHLTISGPTTDDWGRPGDLDFVISFISRSRCSLASLQVTDATLPEADYHAAFPSIQSITLVSTP
jgi:hypothetical protein